MSSTSSATLTLATRSGSTAEQAAHDHWLSEIWQQYKDTGGTDQRLLEALLIEYAPIVKTIASRMASSMPAHIALNDLTAHGMYGLMRAIERFDPTHGTLFQTFCTKHVRGAIQDELRASDHLSRSMRSKIRTTEDAVTSLSARLHRAPTDAEVAAELHVPIDDVREMRAHLSTANVMALDGLFTGEDGTGDSLGDRLPDASITTPHESMDSDETRATVRRAIAALPQRERVLLTLYYFENLTLAQIAQVLGVTEGRTSQLRKEAQVKLASTLSLAG